MDFLPDGFGYINISQFYGTAAKEFGVLVEKFNAANCTSMIIDLRSDEIPFPPTKEYEMPIPLFEPELFAMVCAYSSAVKTPRCIQTVRSGILRTRLRADSPRVKN